MNYIEVDFHIAVKENNRWAIDVLQDELLSIGFESFADEDKGFKGYISEKDFDKEVLAEYIEQFVGQYDDVAIVTFNTKVIEQQNWNAIWESNYPSVFFDDFCVVRPPFNEPIENVKHDIIIYPKMSFGTAHHPTTSLMIRLLRKMKNVSEKRLMDMGCGTGVLAILAKKMGFAYVEAVDNDLSAVENANENAQINDADINVVFLDNWKPQNEVFDVFLANINRNILLQNMETYCRCLKKGGVLALSGFYDSDCEILIAACNALGMRFSDKMLDNSWAILVFEKI
ncbi:MAG: 50S ribosomal protein L11 methyltransferase [Bacteroidales bacterium]|jgi:ribosomal protein L11 methyltransferase|nr:50S ribosomal protein L11 methyltransferase [Bacteroidales bacterium]